MHGERSGRTGYGEKYELNTSRLHSNTATSNNRTTLHNTYDQFDHVAGASTASRHQKQQQRNSSRQPSVSSYNSHDQLSDDQEEDKNLVVLGHSHHGDARLHATSGSFQQKKGTKSSKMQTTLQHQQQQMTSQQHEKQQMTSHQHQQMTSHQQKTTSQHQQQQMASQQYEKQQMTSHQQNTTSQQQQHQQQMISSQQFQQQQQQLRLQSQQNQVTSSTSSSHQHHQQSSNTLESKLKGINFMHEREKVLKWTVVAISIVASLYSPLSKLCVH